MRVYVRANLPGLRARRWADVDEAELERRGYLEMGLVSRTDELGRPAPDELPPNRECCGRG